MAGWWTNPSEKYEFVNWDDDIPNRRKNKINVPNHKLVNNQLVGGKLKYQP